MYRIIVALLRHVICPRSLLNGKYGDFKPDLPYSHQGVDFCAEKLRNKSLGYFKCKEKKCYNPHMSLAYGKHKKSEKDGAIDESVKSLLDHKITISSVAIAENDEYNLKWKIIEKVYLND